MAKTRTKPKGVSKRLLIAILILAIPPAAGWWLWKGQGPLDAQADLIVKKGTTVNQLADELQARGVIRSAEVFKLWARSRKLQIIRGEYTFDARVSLADVAAKLRKGDIHWTSVVIPEGAHAWSVQKRLAPFVPEDAFWKLWKSPTLARTAGFPDAKSLEGLVAPATYKLNKALEPEEVMLELVEAFHRQVYPKLEGGPLDAYQTLTLASLVEKETRQADERARIAGVYYKRYKIGMPLQCDPTSQYARWMSGDLSFTAPTPTDIRRPSPWNTYTVKGFPPTPIAIPSEASIEAALNPVVTKDLYFVATGLGGHRFAPTLREQNKNINLYRKELARQREKG
ncbi:MAG: endolytic transglycosylase MltG [Acidobacteria bacterium]|nr:endolytic transglycosylase MltG [Acidobacteriota bacterium]